MDLHSQCVEESRRVESNYTNAINVTLQERYRSNCRFAHFVATTQAFRMSEQNLSVDLYSKAINKYREMHANYDGFHETVVAQLAAQGAKNTELYQAVDKEIKACVNKLEMQLLAVIMTQQNVLEGQQELAHKTLFASFLEHHESEIFPLPIDDIFAEVSAVLQANATQAETPASAPVPTPAPTPAPAAPAATPWVLYFDEENGHNYYYNAEADESVWEEDATQDIVDAVAANIASENPNSDSTLENTTQDLLPAPVPKPKPVLSPEITAKLDTAFSRIAAAMDSFFHSRVETIFAEGKVLKANFLSMIDAQIENLNVQEVELKEHCDDLYTAFQRELKAFARDQKDSIAAFSLTNSSLVGDNGDDALLHSVISYWNQREVKLRVLSNELLEMSSSSESVAITSNLTSSKQSLSAVEQRMRSTPAPSPAAKLAAASIAAAIKDELMESLRDSDLLTLSQLCAIPQVRSLLPHVLSGGLTVSLRKTDSVSNPNSANSLPSYEFPTFCQRVGEILAEEAVLKDMLSEKKKSDAAFEITFPSIKSKLKDGAGAEAATLARFTAFAIEECLPSDSASLTTVDLFQILRYSTPSGFLSEGDVGLVVTHCFESNVLDVERAEKLLAEAWSASLYNVSLLSWLTTGLYYTGESMPFASNPSPYISQKVRLCDCR